MVAALANFCKDNNIGSCYLCEHIVCIPICRRLCICTSCLIKIRTVILGYKKTLVTYRINCYTLVACIACTQLEVVRRSLNTFMLEVLCRVGNILECIVLAIYAAEPHIVCIAHSSIQSKCSAVVIKITVYISTVIICIGIDIIFLAILGLITICKFVCNNVLARLGAVLYLPAVNFQELAETSSVGSILTCKHLNI